MKKRRIKALLPLGYLLIPAFSMLCCRLFKAAQGEKAEELAGGLVIGLLLDLVYFFALLIIKRGVSHE